MNKFIIFLLLFFPVCLSAQKREIVEAASGEDLSQKVSTQLQYLFPEFTNGAVYYLGAQNGSGKLNYNMLLGEMQFLENNEVRALSNVKNVIVVSIDKRKFYPFNETEFVEELLSTDRGQLLVRRKGNVAPHSKKGAYGSSSSTSSITSYSSISSDNRQYDLSVFEDVLISVNYFYYIKGSNGKYILIRNQKTFMKQFSGHNAQIEAFVKEHNIRFDKEDDLKALLEYCSKL